MLMFWCQDNVHWSDEEGRVLVGMQGKRSSEKQAGQVPSKKLKQNTGNFYECKSKWVASPKNIAVSQ